MAKKTAKESQIHKVNALVELEKLDWPFESTGDDEVAVCCPAHDDSHASAHLNVKKCVWKCHACQAGGDITSFIAHALNKKAIAAGSDEQVTRESVYVKLDQQYGLSTVKTISQAKVEDWHESLMEHELFKAALHERCVTDELMREARLGTDGKRIQIPVFDEDGRCVNVRKYLPSAPGPEKMRNTPGYSKPTKLYQVDQLKYDIVWLCGGEMKALAMKPHLNKVGIGSLSICGAEGSWDYRLSPKFRGKRVFICYDVDKAGMVGARKVAAQLCYEAEIIKIVKLPLSLSDYPTGDANDWLAVLDGNPTEDELKQLMLDALLFEPEDLPADEDESEVEIHDTSLAMALSSKMVGKRLSCGGVIQAMDETPYLVPKRVGVACTKDQPNCHWCPVKPLDQDERTGKVTLTIPANSQGFAGLIGVNKKDSKRAVLEALRIPACKIAEVVAYEHYDVVDARVTPQLEMRGSNRDHIVAPAFLVGKKVELNVPYRLTGRVFPSAKNQQAVLLFNQVESAPDSLSAFDPSNDELEELDIFKAGKSIEDKLDEIYGDLEANVTRIWARRDLLTLMDLTWHSVLYFQLDKRVRSAWINSVVVGDSSQGKSETAIRLMEHYRVGERVDCKNASAAGLIGGLQQLAGRWFISWGIFPIQDRRLVVCEEVKGMTIEELARLTDMRSSGRAQIGKIEKRESHARVRAIFISNPRSNREVASYSFGVSTIRELFGGPEDVRRCDVGLVVSEREVDHAQIAALTRNPIERPEVFTSDLCHRLVLWTWTRSADQVVFSKQAELACLEESERLCKLFRAPAIPLVDSGTAMIKVGKLSAALAARVFSTDKTRQVLRVKESHVRWVGDWLERIYSSATMGYGNYAEAQVFADSVLDKKVVAKRLMGTKYPRDLVQNILHQDEVEVTDIQDWCDLEREDAHSLMSFLVRKHALFRRKRAYYKTGQFIGLLKAMTKDASVTASVDEQTEEF